MIGWLTSTDTRSAYLIARKLLAWPTKLSVCVCDAVKLAAKLTSNKTALEAAVVEDRRQHRLALTQCTQQQQQHRQTTHSRSV